jgi:malate synthase
VGLFIVFENPRAIFRIREIADALYPYFIGGSLGWHDFLASTARLFKHDPNYQIPVKADPYIVINHIKESHQILRDSLSPIGAIAIGGMYGTLYEDGNPESFMLSMVGYIKDVITQMKRGLDGFWVAHPSFVRIGIALVEAWDRDQKQTNSTYVSDLVKALVTDQSECEDLLAFIAGEDVPGLAQDHPLYQRGVLAADIETSDVIANSDEKEVRYNIFQALQYLTDWLCGNGCVALPALLKNSKGDDVFVRVMDDLATTERSRWELWAEVAHGRVSTEMFEAILQEEVDFIVAGQDDAQKKSIL